jgi:thiol:disulfide interchange protein
VIRTTLLSFLASAAALAPIGIGAACQAAPEPAREVIDTRSLPAEARAVLTAAAEAEQPVLVDFHAEW